MTPAFGVEVAKRRDATPTKGEVCSVVVLEARSGGPEIKRGRCPYAVFKRTVGARIFFEEGLEAFCVVVVKPGGPIREGPGSESCQTDERRMVCQGAEDFVVGAVK